MKPTVPYVCVVASCFHATAVVHVVKGTFTSCDPSPYKDVCGGGGEGWVCGGMEVIECIPLSGFTSTAVLI